MTKIKNIPIWERPYEKLMMYGEKALTNSELLSIILRTGTKNKTAIEVAQDLIQNNALYAEDLRFLQNISINEMMKIKGIGKIKAIELKVIGEIAKRIDNPINECKFFIHSAKDVANIFMGELRYERVEVLKLLILNSSNKIQKILTIAKGNENKIVFDIKQILSEPIKMQMPRIIVIHNHPSGNPEPSKKDIIFTQRLLEASQIMEIELLDHIIIGDGIYRSIIQEGL